MAYAERPDYDLVRFFIMKDLENLNLHIDGCYDWTPTGNSPKGLSPIPSISSPLPLMMKSYFEREYCRISVESASMQVGYENLLPCEIDEGVNIGIREMSPKRNNLSSLSVSPKSKFDSYGPDCQSYQGMISPPNITPDKRC